MRNAECGQPGWAPANGSADITPLEGLDWTQHESALDAQGWTTVPGLLDGAQCQALRGLYADAHAFRSHIQMQRHGFGCGEYKYFANPLPALIANLRRAFFHQLVPIANRWREQLGQAPLPVTFESFQAQCHAAGQVRPTPLLLRYRENDYNRLHQDLYGELVFPLQVAVLLSQPGADFEGGEFALTEQKPRSQSRVDVVPLGRGDAVVFAVNERPAKGARGVQRARMRHGVSRVRGGERFTLGIILHDAA